MAHADDVQLFMQPAFWQDLTAPDTEVAVVVTTAGDGGMEKTFWQAREEGLKSSVRFCLAAGGDLAETPTTHRHVNSKAIAHAQIGNCRFYFLRLPDGGLDGNGFGSNGFRSISKLQRKEVASLASLDGAAHYECWEDFCNTLDALVSMQRGDGIGLIELHYLLPDERHNPGDHPDHRATGTALQSLVGCSHICYGGYNGKGTPEPLCPEASFWKTGMFAAYEKTVFDLTGYSTLREAPETYVNWTLRGAVVFPQKDPAKEADQSA